MSGLRAIVPIIIVALLAGAAIGYFTRPFMDDETPIATIRNDRASLTNSDTSDAKPNPYIESSSRRDTPTAPSESRVPDKALPAEPANQPAVPNASSLISGVMSSSETPERPVGDGVITGRVVRAGSGLPIEGVMIVGRMVQGHPQHGEIKTPLPETPSLPGEAELIKQLEMQVRNNRAQRAAMWSVLTGPDGTYSLGGLPEGEYSISATHPRLSIAAEGNDPRGQGGYYDPTYYDPRSMGGGIVTGVYVGGTANFHAIGRRMVFVDVLSADGAPVTSVSLSQATWPRGQEGASIEDVTSALRFVPIPQRWNGPGDYITLPEGVYAIRINLEAELGMVTCLAARVDVLADGPDPRVLLQLVPANGIEVTVTCEDSELLTKGTYSVNVVKATDAAQPDKRALTRSSGMKSLMPGKIRAGNAKAVFPDLEPGNYWAVLHQNNVVLDLKPVTSGSGATQIALSVQPPSREEYVLVKVLSPEGTIMTDTTVTGMVKYTGGSTSSNRSIRMPDGSYKVFHAGIDNDRKMTNPVYSVRAVSRDMGTVTGEYQLGPAAELTLRFQVPAMLHVTIDGAKGHAAEKQLRMSIDGEESNPMRYGDMYGYNPEDFMYRGVGGGNTGVGGVFVFGPMQPREVTMTLSVTPVGNSWGGFELHKEKITLQPGQNAHRIRMPALYSVSVYVPEGRAGLSVSARPRPSNEGGTRITSTVSATLGADLRCVLEHLPAGDYTLTAARMETESISLPGHTSVTMLPSKPPTPSPGR